MNPLALPVSALEYRLAAVVRRRDRSRLELLSIRFSAANLEAVLNDDPVTITVEPRDYFVADRLLGALVREHALFGSPLAATRPCHQPRWRCYRRTANSAGLRWITSVEARSLRRRVVDLCSRAHPTLAAFVNEDVLGSEPASTFMDSLVEQTIVTGDGRETFPTIRVPGTDNRQTVLAHRRSMLKQVPAYSIGEIAGFFETTSVNACQTAADLRKAKRLFGVRAGWSWRYPKFQFDCAPGIHSEMRSILTKLPDEHGWNRLQWFLAPHILLNGETPLEVWSRDRSRVVLAACSEYWHHFG